MVQQALINRFPDEVGLRNAMAVSYLLGGRTKLAQKVLEETLKKWPDDGFAQVHLGFVLKTALGKLEEGAEWMEKGIRSNQSGTMDGRFLFHLGDALHRLASFLKNQGLLKVICLGLGEGTKQWIGTSWESRIIYLKASTKGLFIMWID